MLSSVDYTFCRDVFCLYLDSSYDSRNMLYDPSQLPSFVKKQSSLSKLKEQTNFPLHFSIRILAQWIVFCFICCLLSFCLQVVANIPFNISTDVVKQLLPMGDIFSEVVLLLQVCKFV